MANYGKHTDLKWQKKWEDSGVFKFVENPEKEKLYVLEMFSYPSGSKLHAGHWFNYGPTDSWARMKKMQLLLQRVELQIHLPKLLKFQLQFHLISNILESLIPTLSPNGGRCIMMVRNQ